MSSNLSKVVPIVIAGGSGTRLWPSSRNSFPKQFQTLYGTKSLFQETFLRLEGLELDEAIIIVNEDHKFIAREQLDEINISGKFIIEPEPRNTSPAVSLAAHFLDTTNSEDQYLLILAADHLIEEESIFRDTITESMTLAQRGRIVTFGVEPTSAHTGYGYIEKGRKIKNSQGYDVKNFKEKPSKDIAEAYFQSKDYLWNSGMFLSKKSTILKELEATSKDIFDKTKSSILHNELDDKFINVDRNTFLECKNESIDISVMEKNINLNFENDLKRLEERLDDLVEICNRLQTENKTLKEKQETLSHERASMVQKNEQVRARVEAMIVRLKSMEQG